MLMGMRSSSATNELNIESKKKSGYQTSLARISTINFGRAADPIKTLQKIFVSIS